MDRYDSWWFAITLQAYFMLIYLLKCTPAVPAGAYTSVDFSTTNDDRIILWLLKYMAAGCWICLQDQIMHTMCNLIVSRAGYIKQITLVFMKHCPWLYDWPSHIGVTVINDSQSDVYSLSAINKLNGAIILQHTRSNTGEGWLIG